ncbi:MAG TPA: response regulator [Vicinamibacterales bacterium]|nr:response regulator [Vicinamibacterales bacterium]
MQRLLLVEDHEMSRTMLTRRLHRLGYEVTTATNGRDAVTKAGAWAPHLILMDLSLPVIDGWTAARTLKSDPRTYHIPIVALTANALLGDRERALEVGCDEYETKPVNMARLLEKVQTLLGAEASS